VHLAYQVRGNPHVPNSREAKPKPHRINTRGAREVCMTEIIGSNGSGLIDETDVPSRRIFRMPTSSESPHDVAHPFRSSAVKKHPSHELETAFF